MEIFSIMDCDGCESYKHIPGRTWGDPYQCYPAESECKEGAPDQGPCERMLGAIHDVINDGYLETAHGQFRTRECLQDEQKEEDAPEAFRAFDFSFLPYWFIPFDNNEVPVGYKNVEEIFLERFV